MPDGFGAERINWTLIVISITEANMAYGVSGLFYCTVIFVLVRSKINGVLIFSLWIIRMRVLFEVSLCLCMKIACCTHLHALYV